MKARRSHIFPKATDGHYVEPAWCAERLFEVESFGAPGALVLDPAAGWGNIPRAAAAAGYTAMASDIVDRLDRRGLDGVRFHICNFLDESPVRSAWSIVCNPHFDYIREFCERGLEIATYKVAMIVPLRRLPAARWLESLPLESVYLLTPRPSMPPGEWIAAGNTPGGGREDFCWLVFNKQANPIHPRLRWLACRKKEKDAMTTRSNNYDVAVKLLEQPGHTLEKTFVTAKRGCEFFITGKNGGAITEKTATRLLQHPACHPLDPGLLPEVGQTFTLHWP